MPSKIKVVLDPKSEEMLKAFGKLSDSLTLKTSLGLIGVSYRKEQVLIFDHKQPRSNIPSWAPLSPAYAKRKRIKYGNRPILEATGRLKKAQTQIGGENINKTRRFNATFGSTVPYGHFHDDLKANRTKLPLRNFSIPSERTVIGWEKTLSSDINQQFKRLGVIV